MKPDPENKLTKHIKDLAGNPTEPVPIDLDTVPPENRFPCYIKIPSDAPTVHRYDGRTIDEICDWLENRFGIELPWCVSCDYEDGNPAVEVSGPAFYLQCLPPKAAAEIAADRQLAQEIYKIWESEGIADRPGYELYDAKLARDANHRHPGHKNKRF
jgi:hypothetical protein